jgi:hypothetical protein
VRERRGVDVLDAQVLDEVRGQVARAGGEVAGLPDQAGVAGAVGEVRIVLDDLRGA